jgi:tetratricopeptide (TPR) repeat protein
MIKISNFANEHLFLKSFMVLLISCLLGCGSDNNEKVETTPPVPVIDQRETELIDEIKNHPDSLKLKEKLIQWYRDQSEYTKALNTTDEFIQSDSNNLRLWDIKATLHFEADDTLKAIKALEKKVQLYAIPEDYYKLGMMYAYTGNSNALSISKELIKTGEPEWQANAWLIQGVYETHSNRFSQAIAFFDESLDLNHSFMQTYMEKAVCQDKAGQTTAAINTLQKAVTLNNSYADGYFQLGVFFEKLQNKSAALDAYGKALLHDPEFDAARESIDRLSK